VLAHITSLPGPGPRGTAGEQANAFVDRLAAAGQSVWQMLPIHPPDNFGSPYSSPSAFAGDPRLAGANIDPDDTGYADWRSDNADWVDDWVLFTAIRREQDGRPWQKWPAPLRRRDAGALSDFARGHTREIEAAVRDQFRFHRAWNDLREHARGRGIRLFGDMPIFVALDSADVWAHPELFDLDDQGRPQRVAGVPPDYFSRNGQLWGNPLYDWPAHAADGYRWWKRRVEVALQRFDMVRIDHFRAVVRYWSVPRHHRTARRGQWVDGPGRGFLEAVHATAGLGTLVAEDLGTISPDVFELRREYDIPGMVVLQFGFDDDDRDNPHHPDSVKEDVVCYTGTHDNDTTMGWYLESVDARARHLRHRNRRMQAIMRPGEGPHHALIRTAWETPARMAVAPAQDLLGLDTTARMNYPGRAEGNWTWRMDEEQLDQIDWQWLQDLTRQSERMR
jgi:4-alpha-glucanotransferase